MFGQPYNIAPDLSDTDLHGAWLNKVVGQSPADASPAADDMTVVNPADVHWQRGAGAEFGGTNGYLRRAVSNWRSGDSVGAITAWIRRSVAGALHCIFASCDEVTANYHFAFFVHSTNVLDIIQRDNDAYDDVRGSTVLNAGEWYHVALVSDDTSWAMYVNGEVEALSIIAGANTGDWLAETSNRDSITIGGRLRSALTLPFNGEIRDVRYWSRVLT